MKKLLIFVLAMLVLTVVFVSCSCDGTGESVETPAESTTESTPSSESESTAPESETPVVVDPPVTSDTESSTNNSSSTPVPFVADSQFTMKNETVYAFPNTDGVYNEGKQVNYYSAPAISEGDRAAVHLGYYSDGAQFKRVGIYFENQEKGYGWSKILFDDGKVIYIRNSVLTTDPNYKENAKSTTTGTTDPKPQIELVTEFTAVNEQVKVYPRSDNDIYNPDGKAKVYSGAAVNKDDREGLLLDEDKWYPTGTTLTRVGIYVENPTAPEKDQTGWSKIALEDGSFVYIRNWVLLTPEEYAAKTKAN